MLKNKFNKHNLFFALFILLIIFSIAIIKHLDNPTPIEITTNTSPNNFYSQKTTSILKTTKNTPMPSKIPAQIQVYVIGEVTNPETIVTLKKGQLIHDAIEGAGGLTKNADKSKINLVYELNSNVMLKVLSKEEILAKSKKLAQNVDDHFISGVEIISHVPNKLIETTTQIKNTGLNSKININTAGINELITLNGIGESTANNIIQYRNEQSFFKTIEDIQNVSGIGKNKFNTIKNNICVK